MPPTPVVNVEVSQPGWAGPRLEAEARLLLRFASGRFPGHLARVEVAAGLQPQAEPLVAVQHDPGRAEDEGRAGQVGRVGLAVEGVGQAAQGDQHSVARPGLPSVGGPAGGHAGRDDTQSLLGGGHGGGPSRPGRRAVTLP